MAFKLNTPKTTVTTQDVALSDFQIHVPHAVDPDTGEVVIDRDKVFIEGRVVEYGDSGNGLDGVKSWTFRVPISEIPAGGRTALRQMYEWLEAQAITKGAFGAGVADPIETP